MNEEEQAIAEAAGVGGVRTMRPAHMGGTMGCATCKPVPSALPDTALLEPGFGAIAVMANGIPVWAWEPEGVGRYVSHFTALAKKHKELDWTIDFQYPLRRMIFQWQDRQWVLVEVGPGFA